MGITGTLAASDHSEDLVLHLRSWILFVPGHILKLHRQGKSKPDYHLAGGKISPL